MDERAGRQDGQGWQPMAWEGDGAAARRTTGRVVLTPESHRGDRRVIGLGLLVAAFLVLARGSWASADLAVDAASRGWWDLAAVLLVDDLARNRVDVVVAMSLVLLAALALVSASRVCVVLEGSRLRARTSFRSHELDLRRVDGARVVPDHFGGARLELDVARQPAFNTWLLRRDAVHDLRRHRSWWREERFECLPPVALRALVAEVAHVLGPADRDLLEQQAVHLEAGGTAATSPLRAHVS